MSDRARPGLFGDRWPHPLDRPPGFWLLWSEEWFAISLITAITTIVYLVATR